MNWFGHNIIREEIVEEVSRLGSINSKFDLLRELQKGRVSEQLAHTLNQLMQIGGGVESARRMAESQTNCIYQRFPKALSCVQALLPAVPRSLPSEENPEWW
jgi:hypothetical protein